MNKAIYSTGFGFVALKTESACNRNIELYNDIKKGILYNTQSINGISLIIILISLVDNAWGQEKSAKFKLDSKNCHFNLCSDILQTEFK